MNVLGTRPGRLQRWIDRLRRRWLRHRLHAMGASIDPSAVIDPAVCLGSWDGRNLTIGARSTIHAGVILDTAGGAITIGADTSLNPSCVVYGHGGLVIGDKVRIATQVVIIPANHVIADPDRPIMEQGLTCRGIVIEDDVWIGAGAKILDGVRLGRGCVVAAGAVVTRPVAPGAIVAGVPARVIGRRGAASSEGASS